MDKIYLNIAGFNLLFRIHFTDQRYHTEKFINMLNTDYAGFISNKKEKADFVFDIYSDGSVMLNIEELDKKTKSFNIRLFHINEKKHCLVTHNPLGNFDFEFMVNTVINKYLIPSGKSFAVHGAGVSYRNEAYIFEGRNGAGKSTTAQLLKDLCDILADDSIVIRKIKNQFYFYQTLLHEKNYNFPKSSKAYPVDKVFFIKKADKFYINEIKNKNIILKKMLKQIFTYQDEINKQFAVVVEFVNETKFYELYVKKDEKAFKNFFKKQMTQL